MIGENEDEDMITIHKERKHALKVEAQVDISTYDGTINVKKFNALID